MTPNRTNERRDFLRQSAALALTASLAPGLSWARVATQPAGPQLVLVDPRHAQSREFAAALQSRGAVLFSTADDLGALWYGRLGRAFAEPGARLSGLTTYADYFVSSSFAREPGARSAGAGVTMIAPVALAQSGALYSWSLVRAPRRA